MELLNFLNQVPIPVLILVIAVLVDYNSSGRISVCESERTGGHP